MISPQFFVETLKSNRIDFFTGVPDSLLKQMCAYITDHSAEGSNVITANEGAAIGLASGYYLATGRIPAVYMQNSGIGNAVNPLMSLVDKDVYNIPVLLLIGWRGEPGIKDEPQHIKQGKVTIPLIESMGIKYAVLAQDEPTCKTQLNDAVAHMERSKEPYAIIIRKNTFDEYKLQTTPKEKSMLGRETAIEIVASSIHDNRAVVVSTTGMISRELFEIRERKGHGHAHDFLTVGSMGHASQIALGIAMQKRDRKVFCFDGDGAMLMHMGSMAIIGAMHPENFIHIVFNNGAHDSVGGQPTVGFQISIPQIAKACGYKNALTVSDEESLKKTISRMNTLQGPILLEILVKKGARKDLGRPTTTPIENKIALMNMLNETER